MPTAIIKTKEELLGAIYLADDIRNDKRFTNSFEEGEGIAFQYLENMTAEKKMVSISSFRRFFNLKKEPIISYDTLNKIVGWYYDGKYKNFRSYLLENSKKINSSSLISDKELEELLNANKKEKALVYLALKAA